MSNIPFQKKVDFKYGEAAKVSPLIRRVIARNGGAFTLHGTGTYIIGSGKVAVIDPGPDDEEHLSAIFKAVQGEEITHIFVTHTHRDHSPLAAPLSRATGAPILGCAPHGSGRGPKGEHVEEGADRDYRPTHHMMDGDIIEGTGWTLEAVFTPGHTSNHTCFNLMEETSLFSGDHVMGWSTTIVSPPDGDMYKYMQSLRKLLEREDSRYWPTHGPSIEQPKEFVRALIAHREERETQIAFCLQGQIREIPDMVKKIYADVPEHLHRPAARSVLAHLIHMIDTQRVICTGEPDVKSRFYLA